MAPAGAPNPTFRRWHSVVAVDQLKPPSHAHGQIQFVDEGSVERGASLVLEYPERHQARRIEVVLIDPKVVTDQESESGRVAATRHAAPKTHQEQSFSLRSTDHDL